MTTIDIKPWSKHSRVNNNNVESLNSISKNTSIMIIDDEEDILNLFNDFLQRQGYSVAIFTDPILAVQEIEKNPQEYSLIITDIRMPGITGLELVRIVSKLNKDIKVVIMSAFEINGNNVKQIRYDEYIQKPVHIQVLLQTVKKLIS